MRERIDQVCEAIDEAAIVHLIPRSPKEMLTKKGLFHLVTDDMAANKSSPSVYCLQIIFDPITPRNCVCIRCQKD
jgi:hypothetical protein